MTTTVTQQTRDYLRDFYLSLPPDKRSKFRESLANKKRVKYAPRFPVTWWLSEKRTPPCEEIDSLRGQDTSGLGSMISLT